MNGEIMRYVRDGKGRKIGMLVGASLHPGERVDIGWSRCMSQDRGGFSRAYGLDRARKNLGRPVPPSFLKAAKEFRVQCFLCFRGNLGVQRIEVMPYAKQPRKAGKGKAKNGGHRKGCKFAASAKSPIFRKRKASAKCNCHELAKQDEAAEAVVESVGVLQPARSRS